MTHLETNQNQPPTSPIAHLVVGSGPAGFATALSLLDAGETVFVIDPNRSMHSNNKNVRPVSAQKSFFGSTEMYEMSDLAKLTGATSGIPYSEVRGGLSSTWGAGLQVFPNSHFQSWPCAGDGIQFAYKRLLEEISHTHFEDSISNQYPWPERVRSSPPKSSKLTDLIGSAQGIDDHNRILLGYARLAIENEGMRSCKECLGCLEGCPYDSIFNSGNTLLRISRNNDRLHLIQGFVDKIDIDVSNETLIKVQIFQDGGKEVLISAKKVYLSLGAIATPALLLRSQLMSDKIIINDSQVFYTAFISFKKLVQKKGLSLAQIFVTNKGKETIPFHLSLYSPNFEIAKRIEAKIHEITRIRIRLPKFIWHRIVAGIGFVSPDLSGHLQMHAEGESFSIKRITNENTALKVSEVNRQISDGLRKIGLYRLPFSLQIPEIGSGFHSGGGVSNYCDEDGPIVDKYGKYRKFPNLVICDASGMPFDIAGPHTLTAMAFAYRNARES